MELAVQEEKGSKTLPKKVVYRMSNESEGAQIISPYSTTDGRGNSLVLRPMGAQNIPNDDVILVNGVRKAIRYIAASSTLDVLEQIKEGFPKDYRFQATDKINFESGELIVFPQTTPALYEYLTVSNRNGSNPNRIKGTTTLFYEDNVEAKAKKHNDKDRMITKAKMILIEAEDNPAQLKNIATVLNQDMNSDPQTLMMNLYNIAASNPKLILDAFLSNEGDVASLVWDAVEKDVINFTGFGWKWTGGEEKLTVPGMQGKQTEDNARKKLIDYLTSEAGDSTRQILEGVVKKR